jgi:hypothetical protein
LSWPIEGPLPFAHRATGWSGEQRRMKMARLSTRLIAFSVLAASSCGGGNGGGSNSSGVPSSATLASLTTAQATTLCDWENEKQGGYGRTVSCSDGSQQTTDPNQATCVGSVPNAGADCPTLTVGDIEDCANAIGADICQVSTAPGCHNFWQCVQQTQ